MLQQKEIMVGVSERNGIDGQPEAALPPVVSRALRRKRKLVAAATLALVCSGVTSCTKTQVGLSVTAIAAVLVGTTVGVTLAVEHNHYTLLGCIVTNANGMQLRTNKGRLYTLKGDLADVKVGDRVKIHGSRVKKVKGNSPGDQVFVMEKINKNYGSCLAPH
jgi:hypothetical protein